MPISRVFPVPRRILRFLTSRRLLITLGMFATILITTYLSIRLYLVYQAQRAGEMLSLLETTRIGDSEDSVLRVLHKYDPQQWTDPNAGERESSYWMEVAPCYFRNVAGHGGVFERTGRRFLALIDTFPAARRAIGLRLWAARGQLQFSDGRVKQIRGQVLVEGTDEWLGGGWNLEHEIPARIRQRYADVKQPWPQLSRYVVGWSHLQVGGETGEEVHTWITPTAPEAELYAARHIKLSCLTSAKGCWALCNLMPEASLYNNEHPEASWGGIWGKPERTCR